MTDVLEEALRLEREGEVNDALDLLWDHLDDALYDDALEGVDLALKDLLEMDGEPHVLLGVLCITLPAMHRLTMRAAVYEHARAMYEAWGMDVDLLKNLNRYDEAA